MKYTYAQTLAPIAVVAKFFQLYRDEAEKAGYQASPDQLAWSNTIYVAETDAQGDARGQAAHGGAGQQLPEDADRDAAAARLQQHRIRSSASAPPRSPASRRPSRTWCAPASSSIGSPNTVREKLAEYQDLAGFNTSLTKTQFGTLPDDMTRANMDAVAQEILPYFRNRLPQGKSRPPRSKSCLRRSSRARCSA